MALIVEFRRGGAWHQAGPQIEPDVNVTDAAGALSVRGGGSLSHNGPGGREIYWFACLGESSVIMRSRHGVDCELAGGAIRALSALDGFEEIARLSEQDPTFECWLKTDRMREPMRMRFRHLS